VNEEAMAHWGLLCKKIYMYVYIYIYINNAIKIIASGFQASAAKQRKTALF